MEPSDALFARLALSRGWISRHLHDSALDRVQDLQERGLSKNVEDVLRESGAVAEDQLRILRRLLSRFTRKARVGDYDLLRRIGIGGTGMVFEARHRRIGRHVAIKILFPRLGKAPGMTERFLNEARVLARIDHPNVVHAYDAGNDGAFYFIAMEIVAGEDLSRLLKRREPLSAAECMGTLLPVTRALAAIHGAGLLHRDVKPANILIANDATIKLVDLGLFFADEDRRVIWDGMVFGTPNYMAPEQIRGDPHIDARADLYSLGVTWYHALGGKPPFDYEDQAEIIRAHLEEPVVPLREHRPEVPSWMDDLVLWLMKKRPVERPASAKDVVRVLEKFGASDGMESVIPSIMSSTRNLAAPAHDLSPGSEPPPAGVLDRTRRAMMGKLAPVMFIALFAIFFVIGMMLFKEFPGSTSPADQNGPGKVDPTQAKIDSSNDSAATTTADTPETTTTAEPRPSIDVVAARKRSLAALRELIAGGQSLVSSANKVLREAMPAAPYLEALVMPEGTRVGIAIDLSVWSWVEKNAATVQVRFIERLKRIGSEHPIRLVIDENHGPSLISVKCQHESSGELRLLDGETNAREVPVAAVHPASVLIWGALTGGQSGPGSMGVAYALKSGRLDWARRIHQVLKPSLPAAVEAYLLKAKSAGTSTPKPVAEVDNHLDWVLTMSARLLSAGRLFQEGQWDRAAREYDALATAHEIPDPLLDRRQQWVQQYARALDLDWLTRRLFHTSIEVLEPERGWSVTLRYPFENKAELQDFRWRPGRWTIRKGELVCSGRASGEAIDTVAIFRLPLTIEGSWLPPALTAGQDQSRGHMAILFEELTIAMGGPQGEVTILEEGSEEEREFFTGTPSGTGGKFRLVLRRDRLLAELPDEVRMDTATPFPLPAFGRLSFMLGSKCRLENLEITGVLEPLWLKTRLDAMREADKEP